MTTTHVLGDLEARLAGGGPGTRADAERIFRCPDLVSVGVVGESARRALTGGRVTFGRVLDVSAVLPSSPGDAGEVRLVGVPASIEDARARVRAVVAWAGERPVTGFAAADLVSLCDGDLERLTRLAADLAADGLVAVSEVAVDRAASDDDIVSQVRAIVTGGLGAWRLTVHRAESPDVRLALIERARAAGVDRRGQGLRASAARRCRRNAVDRL